MRDPLPDWLDKLDNTMVTVKLHGTVIGRGTLMLFGSEGGSHMVDLHDTLLIILDNAELKLEEDNTLCINAKLFTEMADLYKTPQLNQTITE